MPAAHVDIEIKHLMPMEEALNPLGYLSPHLTETYEIGLCPRAFPWVAKPRHLGEVQRLR